MKNGQLVSLNEASRILGTSRWSIYRLRKKGLLKAVKIGGKVKFKMSDLKEYIESSAEEFETDAVAA